MGYEKLGFAHVSDESIASHAETSLGNIVLFKKFDEKRNNYEGKFTVALVKDFVDTNSFATVMDFDDRAIEKVF